MEQESLEKLKKKIASSFLWNLLEKAGGQGVALLVQIIMARILSPEDFGFMAIMIVFVNVGNVIVQSGLNTALIQTKKLDEKDPDTAFWMCFSTSLLLYIALFFLAPNIAEFYQMQKLTEPLRVLCLVLVFNSLYSIQAALVTRDLAFKRIFIATFTAMVVSGISGVATAILGGGIWALVVQQVLYSIIASAVLTLETKWFPHFRFSPKRARTLFQFGWKLLVSGLLETLYESLSDLIVGKLFSAGSLGFFNQGKKYPQALAYTLDSTIQPIMLSTVSRVQDNLDDVKGLTRRALKTSTYLIMPIMSYMAVAANSLVTTILGSQWAPAVPYFQAFCISFMLIPIHTTNLQALNGMGRSDLYLKLELIKKSYGIVMILLTALIMQDLFAICVGYVITGVISTFVNAYPNKRIINYSYREQLVDIGPTVISVAISSVLGIIVECTNLFHDGFLAIVQLAVMAAGYFVLSALTKNESFLFLVKEIGKRVPLDRK